MVVQACTHTHMDTHAQARTHENLVFNGLFNELSYMPCIAELLSLTLGAHVQQGLQCLCVCVSVTQHLTFHVFICATNNTNLFGGG